MVNLTDSAIATVLVVFLIGTIGMRSFSSTLLDLLLKLTPHGATVLLLLVVAYLFYKLFVFSALALALIAIYLLKDVWIQPYSSAQRLRSEVAADQVRFTNSGSLDLQVANGLGFDSSPFLHPGSDVKHQLIFPPKPEELEALSG